MENQQTVENYASAMVDNELNYYEKHRPERFKLITADDKTKARQRATDRGRELAEHILAKDAVFLDRLLHGLLHPENKVSRKLFTELTDIELPKTVKATFEVAKQYCQSELTAYLAEQAKQEMAQENRKKVAKENEMQEVLTDACERLGNGEQVGATKILELVRFYGLAIHPRTAGVLSDTMRITTLGLEACKYRGRKPPQSVYAVAQSVYEFSKRAEYAN